MFQGAHRSAGSAHKMEERCQQFTLLYRYTHDELCAYKKVFFGGAPRAVLLVHGRERCQLDKNVYHCINIITVLFQSVIDKRKA